MNFWYVQVIGGRIMRSKDLMIGDWVMYENNPNMITEISELAFGECSVCFVGNNYMANIDEIEPIPLTEEILKKNGWMYNEEDEKFFPQTWVGGGLMLQGADDCGYRIVVTSDYDDEDTNDTPFILLYVHELQHALRLRRIEKEIIL